MTLPPPAAGASVKYDEDEATGGVSSDARVEEEECGSIGDALRGVWNGREDVEAGDGSKYESGEAHSGEDR